MEIRRLDATDPVALRAWHTTHHAATRWGQDFPPPCVLEEMRAQFLGNRVSRSTEPFGGYVGGEPVVTGILTVPMMDNLGTAHVRVATKPDRRRHGLGSAMLDHLTAAAAALGRRTLQADASWAYDDPPDGVGTPGGDFLTKHGFVFSLGDVKRALPLPVDDGLLERLEREAAPYHGGYALRDWAGPVPEDLVDRYGDLMGSLMSEAPMGDLDIEAEVIDATRIRADEQVLAEAGRTKHSTVAVAPDGELVAYSELAVPSFDKQNVYQWGTLVRPAHRGHRLGLATKVHNLRRFQSREAGRSVIMTFNAEVNAHMIAVNDRLGFRPVARLGEFQKRL
jgi:GNAT superfamily N-acetyltransferase